MRYGTTEDRHVTDPTAAAILKQIESLATLLRSFRNEVVELDAVPAGDELPSLNIVVANLIKPIPSHPRDVIVGIDPAVGPDGVLQREHHAGAKWSLELWTITGHVGGKDDRKSATSRPVPQSIEFPLRSQRGRSWSREIRITLERCSPRLVGDNRGGRQRERH